MEIDESFVEYVSARWSMHYRLAVLLVGADEADDLAVAALARACVSWRQLREDPATDRAVKKLLVGTAVATALKRARRGDVAAHPWSDEPDAEKLWTRISALPPRQRAVVVLLYYEGLSEPEAGGMLGCSTATVKSEAFAALDQHLDLSDFTTRDLREELIERADEAAVPLPPLDAIARRAEGERRRRRRRSLGWTALAGLAVVVALTVTSVLAGTDEDRRRPSTRPAQTTAPAGQVPATLARMPEGDPADVVYSSGRVIHIDGITAPLVGQPSALVETPSYVFSAYPNGKIVQIERANGAVVTLTATAAGPMATDAAGKLVAWPVVEGGQAKVVLRPVDPERGAVEEAQTEQVFPITPRCCDSPFLVVGITLQGEVIASLPALSKAWVWDTRGSIDGSSVREIEGLGNGEVHEIAGNDLVVLHRPYHYAVGELSAGTFYATGELAARAVHFGDPLGRRVVFVDAAGETHVRGSQRPRGRRGVGNDVRLQIPVLDGAFASARFEDTDHVLIDVADDLVPFGALVRCEVTTGACEIALRFDGPHIVGQ